VPVTIFHNPKCATSRATLKLIRDHGIEPRVVEYLTATPSKAELAELIRRLGLTPRQLLRTREPEYKRAGLDDPRRSDAAILAAMVKHPRLIERPIVTRGRKAVLGRPPERVLELLE
jgi:arsenate reductase